MTTPTATAADIIDLLAGIAPGAPLAAVRDQRAQARENAQRSFAALLEPAEPGTFPLAERYAVAAFVAQLHGFGAATAFYGDLLGDEAPELVAPVAAAAAVAASDGPYGEYREPKLAAESTPGLRWSAEAADAAASGALGARLAAAFAHTHLLVFRPREARADALRALADASWSADDIVSLSQLVAFLSFQLRLAWGLRVLAAASDGAVAASTASAASTEGALR
ncbi:MAG: CMD domain protein [Microbacterium sp.]|uniref:CMD domain protein n=1 Tax=Microbacterium sp. TaxID=51671 RepID=UPI001AC62829|nr:CMD domain protein [Microbacterium sp.]MBN9177667.1 CMD domain protein [Microbacterium sp.]